MADIVEALGGYVQWDPGKKSLVIFPRETEPEEYGPKYNEIFTIRRRQAIEKDTSPEEVLLKYFEALYWACNIPEDSIVPLSGTIGDLKDPYPGAYSCWSKDWQAKNSFDDFLHSWEGTVNVELLKLIDAGETGGQRKFFVETRNMEAIEDPKNPRIGVFCYKGYFTVKDSEEGWRISDCQLEA